MAELNKPSGYDTTVFIIQLILIGLYFLFDASGLLWGAAGAGFLVIVVPPAGWIADVVLRSATATLGRAGGVALIGLFALIMLLIGFARKIRP